MRARRRRQNLTFSGNVRLTADDYVGGTLIGSVSQTLSGSTFFSVNFVRSDFTSPVTPRVTVDFAKLNAGTIDGLLVVRVSGGSVVNLDSRVNCAQGTGCPILRFGSQAADPLAYSPASPLQLTSVRFMP